MYFPFTNYTYENRNLINTERGMLSSAKVSSANKECKLEKQVTLYICAECLYTYKRRRIAELFRTPHLQVSTNDASSISGITVSGC